MRSIILQIHHSLDITYNKLKAYGCPWRRQRRNLSSRLISKVSNLFLIDYLGLTTTTGINGIERSAQEDILFILFNAAISSLVNISSPLPFSELKLCRTFYSGMILLKRKRSRNCSRISNQLLQYWILRRIQRFFGPRLPLSLRLVRFTIKSATMSSARRTLLILVE